MNGRSAGTGFDIPHGPSAHERGEVLLMLDLRVDRNESAKRCVSLKECSSNPQPILYPIAVKEHRSAVDGFLRQGLPSFLISRCRSGEIGIRSRLKISGKRRFNNFQDIPKPTENIVQTHDWHGFFANVPSENG